MFIFLEATLLRNNLRSGKRIELSILYKSVGIEAGSTKVPIKKQSTSEPHNKNSIALECKTKEKVQIASVEVLCIVIV